MVSTHGLIVRVLLPCFGTCLTLWLHHTFCMTAEDHGFLRLMLLNACDVTKAKHILSDREEQWLCSVVLGSNPTSDDIVEVETPWTQDTTSLFPVFNKTTERSHAFWRVYVVPLAALRTEVPRKMTCYSAKGLRGHCTWVYNSVQLSAGDHPHRAPSSAAYHAGWSSRGLFSLPFSQIALLTRFTD